MMTCEEGTRALESLLFSELDDATHSRLNEHLVACENCRALEQNLLALRADVQGRPSEPGEALRARIHAAHSRSLPATMPLWRRPVPAYAALLGMALCVLLAGVFARSRPASAPVTHEATVEAPTVALPGGGLAFSQAGAYDTRVSGQTDTSSRLSRRASRGDTL